MNFNQFRKLIIESILHPELKEIIQSVSNPKEKKIQVISQKIKNLTERGESTGLENEMPTGSSRAFLTHEDPLLITIDGKPLQQVKIGTKIAINALLDNFHKSHEYENLKLGALQNKVEGADDIINNFFRILVKDTHNPDHYVTNEKMGIFPPLFDYDYKTHEWIQIGFCESIKNNTEFKELTKEYNFPEGITHLNFCETLNRNYNMNIGRYHKQTNSIENYFNKLETHSLIKKFIIYHKHTLENAYDYQQLANLGIFKHPITKKEYIVARDHGFSNEVADAYSKANQIMMENDLKKQFNK